MIKNKLIIDEKAASVVRQIFKWKIGGMSGARIAEKLNELGIPTPMQYKHISGENFQCGFRRKAAPKWQANSVNYILRNETYTGVLLQGILWWSGKLLGQIRGLHRKNRLCTFSQGLQNVGTAAAT